MQDRIETLILVASLNIRVVRDNLASKDIKLLNFKYIASNDITENKHNS